MATHHIIVTGKVQGVFFRATAKKTAISFGLGGWVKNTAKGDVEMLVSGPDEKLAEFEEWCKIGPSHAQVEEVIVAIEADTQFNDFKILK